MRMCYYLAFESRGDAMVFEYKNSRGKTYYLHSRGKLFYFSKDKADGIDLPSGYKVVESEKTGLPMLKKE